jgi:hypothetical protein
MASKYQTITGFLMSPFKNGGNVERDATYDSKYRSFVTTNKIKVFAMCVIEDSYYIHVKVPSESQKDGKYEYDVVIRFFTDNPEVQAQETLRNYYVQFFSNSPSFMYQYAYLYNKEGFLIETLYNKLDADYIDTPPEKTNANMTKSYDKSIYFACRFLSEQKFRYLNKKGHLMSKKVDDSKFFSNISDFKSVKLDQALMSEERKLSNLIKQKAPRSLLGKAKSGITGKRIEASNTTSADKSRSSITYIKKAGGKAKIVGGTKKTSSRSTKR